MQHPVTTEFRQSQAQVNKVLAAVHRAGRPAVWFWPNVDAGADGTSQGIRRYREKNRDSAIHFFKTWRPRTSLNSFSTVSASSATRVSRSVSAPFSGSPLSMLSRQLGRERGRNVLDVGYNADEIFTALTKRDLIWSARTRPHLRRRWGRNSNRRNPGASRTSRRQKADVWPRRSRGVSTLGIVPARGGSKGVPGKNLGPSDLGHSSNGRLEAHYRLDSIE